MRQPSKQKLGAVVQEHFRVTITIHDSLNHNSDGLLGTKVTNNSDDNSLQMGFVWL